ncbi:hypothetical protein [Marinifilum caeruleilacunae]|uniref:Uncharacterized protein n=1 Tax=Marinifilum caeruleilacunae TaxID=2499076 RepID=A0ABX1WWM7_9BACT|nr:hypothetical protein [Marinifilum caeruleilacunae]NOU60524.1 hypothetical protein [Marinifilum caeruleilacunae]
MKSFSLYKTIYFLGVVLIFVGGYRLFKQLSYGDILFSIGIICYSGVQIFLLFYKAISDWKIFEYLKMVVNVLFLLSIILLMILNLQEWYYPFILGLLIDFFTNILKRIKS